VQRRILHTLFEMDDGKFHKVANVIGETMKLHPHGDASIGDALVVLANKDYFIERRATSATLSPATPPPPPLHRVPAHRARPRDACSTALTEFRPSYDGRNEEPVVLPAKLPVVLMLGAEGIAVGMATRILPHNFPSCRGADPNPRGPSRSSSTRTFPGRHRRRQRVRRRSRQGAGAGAGREEGREDGRHPRDPLLHHHREA
jgi:hypothetical protein